MNQYKNLNRIFLCGGNSEPMAYKNMIPLIKYIQNRGIKVDISTNGSLHKKEWWHSLGRVLKKGDNVSFTIDGHTQALHEKYRVGADLNKILYEDENLI